MRGQHRVLGQAVLAVRAHATANDGVTAPRDGRFDPARPQRHCTLHNRKVALVGRPGQQRCGKGVFRAQHQAACVFVNAVYRAEDAAFPPLPQVVQPAVGQCAVRVVQRGVHGNARGLVEYRSKIVLIGDGKRHGLRGHTRLLLGRERKADALPGVYRLIRADGLIVSVKAVTVIFDRLDQSCRNTLHAQEQPQLAALVFRRHGITQNGHSTALLKAYMRVLYHKTPCDANPNVWQKGTLQQQTALPEESRLCYFCDCSSAARSSTGRRYCPVKECGFCATSSGVPVATMVPPQLLLLDEHTAALDPATAEKVLDLTRRCRPRGRGR